MTELSVGDRRAVKDLVHVILNSICKTERVCKLIVDDHPLDMINRLKDFDSFVSFIGEKTVEYLEASGSDAHYETSKNRIRKLIPKLRITKDKLII